MGKKHLFLQLDMVEYGKAWELQKALLEARISGKIEDCLVLLQHPPTFTYGRRYKGDNLITNRDYYEMNGFAVYKTDRGGLATYHGPGQVVGYPIIKMSTYTNDYYQYLRMLEEVMMRTLSDFGVDAERNKEYTGVWVNQAKIGFIGVRIALGYTMHGFSLNVNNDLSPFNHITPCGIQRLNVTSIQKSLSSIITVKEVCHKLANYYSEIFQVRMISVERRYLIRRVSRGNAYVKT
ncbi:MAG: lipoyl(octanoyl) transferase LipB [Candidatus Brocadia sp.]|nr:lipoyl(octanoyl) transferase LipB [Candidatus Brocadia sp.]